MTLDSITRSKAEARHFTLKASLERSRQEFQHHFTKEKNLFRSLPCLHGTNGSNKLPGSVTYEREDIVQQERLLQCCKRVRAWRRPISNPLLQYKPTLSLVQADRSAGTKSDKRMHITLLLSLIVDIYEQGIQKIPAPKPDTLPMNIALESAGLKESFPESVARFIAGRASSHRAAIEQIQSVVMTVQLTASQPRVRLFGSLCGLDSSYNIPEKSFLFYHLVHYLHKCKVAQMHRQAGNADPIDVVFYQFSVAQSVVNKVISDLFMKRDPTLAYYWHFEFWMTHMQELHTCAAWPANSINELQTAAVNLATISRNALLNNSPKVDVDAFLELLIEAWTTRASAIADELDRATQQEENEGKQRVQARQALQLAHSVVQPVSIEESRFFDKLIEEYWNAPIPWQSDIIQWKIADLPRRRPLRELISLYDSHFAKLSNDPNRPWNWHAWAWEYEWEWGVLLPDK